MLLLSAVFLAFLGFQTAVVLQERARLGQVHAEQEATFSKAQRLRAQLDSIAKKTALLADSGNQNAQRLVDELRKRGVTINPDAGKE